MIYEKFHPGKSLFIVFLFLLSLMVFPSVSLSKDKAKDRVLFMIAEQNIEQTHFFYWWSWWSGKGSTEYKAEVTDISISETALKGAFIKAGFRVVDPGAIKGDVEIEDPYRVEDLTINNTTGFGKVFGADIVIKGRALAKKGIKNPEVKLGVYMADITAQAIRVSDGHVIASARGHGVSRHLSATSGAIDALEKAAKALSKELMQQMAGQGE